MIVVMDGMSEFGALVRRARESRGWTQTDLARRLGYTTHNLIFRIEGGKLSNPPDPETMRALERELGISRRRMLEVMGYLDPDTDTDTDTITIPVTDPRARVVAALDGLPDHAANQWAVAISAITGASTQNAMRGVSSTDTATETKAEPA